MIIRKPTEKRNHAVWWKVEAPCEGERGNWHCITHNQGLQHNLAMWAHEKDFPKCKIAWFCPDHGFEHAKE